VLATLPDSSAVSEYTVAVVGDDFSVSWDQVNVDVIEHV
jgi:hypothetical protein